MQSSIITICDDCFTPVLIHLYPDFVFKCSCIWNMYILHIIIFCVTSSLFQIVSHPPGFQTVLLHLRQHLLSPRLHKEPCFIFILFYFVVFCFFFTPEQSTPSQTPLKAWILSISCFCLPRHVPKVHSSLSLSAYKLFFRVSQPIPPAHTSLPGTHLLVLAAGFNRDQRNRDQFDMLL